MKLQSKGTKDHYVYMKLKEMIFNRQLQPGEYLVQSQLTEKLGVSRTPLRKALGELEMEGLLESTSKGWFVKEFTQQDMISVYEIRAVLEGLACRLIANVISNAEIAFLRTTFMEAYEKADQEAYLEADVYFHDKIIILADDPVLHKTLQSCRIIRTSHFQKGVRSREETHPEHLEILDALQASQGLIAEQLMRAHIQRTIPLLKG